MKYEFLTCIKGRGGQRLDIFTENSIFTRLFSWLVLFEFHEINCKVQTITLRIQQRKEPLFYCSTSKAPTYMHLIYSFQPNQNNSLHNIKKKY